jgi:hypothetical protein
MQLALASAHNLPYWKRVDWPLVAFLVFVIANVFTGPIRWIFAVSGLVPLIYIPIMAIGVCFLAKVLHLSLEGNIGRAYFFTLIVIGSAFVSGVLHTGSATQVIFGFYVLWPFFFGLVFGNQIVYKLTRYTGWAVFFWVAACAGVIINNFTTYPWEGFEYSVGGLEVESSREWYSGDATKRLAGFSRASFDAAIQISLASCFVLALPIGKHYKLIICAVSVFATYYTNAKGMLLAFAAMFAISFLQTVWMVRVKPFVFTALMLLGILLPVVSWLVEYQFDITGIAANPTVFSFTDRIENMWPEALRLTTEHGSFWLGRGFGGLGVAQSHLESHLFNAADNVFVYAFVVGGVFMIPVSIICLIKFMTRVDGSAAAERLTTLLMIVVIVYGLTANVFENALMALVLGILVRYGFLDPTGNKKEQL